MGVVIDMQEWLRKRNRPEDADARAERLATEARTQARIAAYTRENGSATRLEALRKRWP